MNLVWNSCCPCAKFLRSGSLYWSSIHALSRGSSAWPDERVLSGQRRGVVQKPSSWQDTSVNKVEEWGDLVVLFSRSTNVQWNLALEEWISLNALREDRMVLLFYVNTPSVVIGRMQNPWLEADLDYLRRNHVTLARRRSGGGAVYHDLGNLNISFLTPKDRYKRSAHLEWVTECLRSAWPAIELKVSDKGDMRLPDASKISGSAARITTPGSYQHCTLLVQADSHALFSSLEPTLQDGLIRTSSTASRRSSISDLQSLAPDCTVDRVRAQLADRFVQDFNTADGGKTSSVLSISPPTSLSGSWREVDKLYDEYETWEWTFGKTPRFHVHHEVTIGGDAAILDLEVEHCRIKKITLTSSGPGADTELESTLQGMPLRDGDWRQLADQYAEGTFERQACHAIASLFWPSGEHT
ncbi:lipoate-protein ligase A-like [Sycon ciliatum]|uniref:lipoate-protein ligase A-like n=1 Tax=Sycon ciliatum TaxID=27933 RepID=UPI0031F6D209